MSTTNTNLKILAGTLTHAMGNGPVIREIVTDLLLRPRLYREVGASETALPEELAALGFLPEPVTDRDGKKWWGVCGLGILNETLHAARSEHNIGVTVEGVVGELANEIVRAVAFSAVKNTETFDNGKAE
jgi:hypothetical protein